MYKIWFEWQPPADSKRLLDGVATMLGPATLTPIEPFSDLRAAQAIIAAADLQYTDEVMGRAPELRVISRIGVGCDNIDLASASQRGIVVCNAPDAPTVSTAEHAIALMFAVAKGIPSAQSLLRRGVRRNFFEANEGRELAGTILGIVGFGRIGQRVAEMARGLGMIVEAYDPHVAAKVFESRHVKRCVSLDELLTSADVLTLHLPLRDENHHLIGRAALASMKPHAILINTSRGGLVDEEALREALESRRLFGAGLDVFGKEPPDADHPLLSLENVVATPHISSATDVSKSKLWTTAISQALDVLAGRPPLHVVNRLAN